MVGITVLCYLWFGWYLRCSDTTNFTRSARCCNFLTSGIQYAVEVGNYYGFDGQRPNGLFEL